MRKSTYFTEFKEKVMWRWECHENKGKERGEV